jgi:hypothetical protein
VGNSCGSCGKGYSFTPKALLGLTRTNGEFSVKNRLARADSHQIASFTRANLLLFTQLFGLPVVTKEWTFRHPTRVFKKVAAIISVIETCRRLKIPVRDYLGSVLPGLGDFPISRIAELTPAAWATRN